MKNVKSFATILLEKSFLNKMKDIIQEKALKMQKDGWAKYKNENAKYLDTKKKFHAGKKVPN